MSSIQSLCRAPSILVPSTFLGCSSLNPLFGRERESKCCRVRRIGKKIRLRGGGGIVCGVFLPVDPWAPSIDSQSIASQLFAASLFPYLGFLYFITKSKTAPKLTLFGFYFLLAFVGATSEFLSQPSLSNFFFFFWLGWCSA